MKWVFLALIPIELFLFGCWVQFITSVPRDAWYAGGLFLGSLMVAAIVVIFTSYQVMIRFVLND